MLTVTYKDFEPFTDVLYKAFIKYGIPTLAIVFVAVFIAFIYIIAKNKYMIHKPEDKEKKKPKK